MINAEFKLLNGEYIDIIIGRNEAGEKEVKVLLFNKSMELTYPVTTTLNGLIEDIENRYEELERENRYSDYIAYTD